MTGYLRRKIREAIVSGSVRGSLCTVSGYPLTLTDCRILKSLTIHGNDGGVGDKTNNLFDKDITNISDWTYDYVAHKPNNGKLRYIEITRYLMAGKTYTIYYSLKDESDIPRYFYLCSDDDVLGDNVHLMDNIINTKCKSFTANAGKRYYLLSALDSVNKTDATFSEWTSKFDRCGIIEGAYTKDTLPKHEPFGYKIPLMLNSEYILYSPASLMRSENITVDFESRSAKLAGMNISHLQQWGSVPTGAMVITANTTVAPSMMSATYYTDTEVL